MTLIKGNFKHLLILTMKLVIEIQYSNVAMSSRHSNSSCCSLLDDASMADLSNADWDILFHEEWLDIKGNLTPSMSSDECINSKKCIAYNDCIVKLLKATIGDF